MTTDSSPPRCDNASVGVIITGPAGFLMFDRATFPAGTAPVAGHVFDAHDGYTDAAAAEVEEELGLSVTSLELVTGGWRANRCRRTPGPRGIGHHWQVFVAEVAGTLSPSPRETRNARWLHINQVQDLATRTADYAAGRLPATEYRCAGGMEPVWLRWFCDLGGIRVRPDDLTAVDALAAHPHLIPGATSAALLAHTDLDRQEGLRPCDP
ncbi:NUDIX domain-containing protein [Actinomadura gamaensis]|uniref:NUDIX domain-containing protein n=1 Tax=Actinomadura gamaensis TaxID=1763541 RepID=A0ABV9TT21_9ACTN